MEIGVLASEIPYLNVLNKNGDILCCTTSPNSHCIVSNSC